MTGARAGLEVHVLGPLKVSVDGQPVAVTSGRLRTLLAVLALSVGTAASAERLAAAVFDQDPPADARAAIQLYLARLRAALGADAIRTSPAGYLLRVAPDNVDAVRFTRLLDAAAVAPAGSQRVLLDEALALWRGTPFEGLRSAWLQDVESARLRERYLDALERRVDLDLADGRHSDLIAELTILTSQHPLRERFWGQLMLALYRSCRQADALDAYRRLRRLLADELGIEPSGLVQELHRQILNGDSALDAPVAQRRPEVPVPRQLPAGIAHFAGRTEILNQLDALLPPDGEDAPMVVISAIAGTAGVGKTALAVHWAHRVADRFPDGHLYVNLRGFDPAGQVMGPAQAVRHFLDAFGVPAQRMPASLDAQAALYRSIVAGKRMLIVLDNARDADQVRALLPGAPGCLVLVTSRNRLSGLIAVEAAHPVALDVLAPDEARHLLATRLGADRVAAEPHATDEIIDRCARLPLALAIVASRAGAHPHFGLADFAEELRDAATRLDVLAGEDAVSDLRTVLSWSYRQLTPAAARLFRMLGLHPGPEFSLFAAASLADLPAREVRPLLAELDRAHLIVEQRPARYAFHDLLRTYAAELSWKADREQDREAAVTRMLDHYLQTSYIAARLLYPARDPIALLPPRPGVTAGSVAGRDAALAWFTTEHAALLAAIRLAAETSRAAHTWQLAWTLTDYLDWQGHWHDWEATARTALDAARGCADEATLARIHRFLARAATRLGRHDSADAHLQRALALCRQSGDRVDQAHTHHALASQRGRAGCHVEALAHAERALALYREADHYTGQAATLNAVGWYHAQLGRYGEAVSYCQQALTLLQEVGDRHGEADTWDSLGYAHHHRGSHTEAIACYERSLQLHRELGDRYFEAENLAHIGDAHHAVGNDDAAAAAWREAIGIYDELDHTDAHDIRIKLKELFEGERGAAMASR